ncbi:MAG: hypothetical protein UU08_C0007G0015 [Candidatus Uhrbacteria bacterium GW2011_GWE2_40_58]|nr:MAG: hypothetical protein UT94_C0015G0015 [Candidatus Uhrbacteria bacterium GW2011_GWF2_40_263]KKR67861.1 MAG: hypothetical protein UU08_C0007G0015 [Candidatus Uhrbacteria bacterium GW2011_GWE2_40_58]OGL92569.1 MAG: hypothetical protein A2239_04775 [Candidatus Uhrbacteria bacterium RIFOXYA2_FULL_40_9]
MNTLEPIRSLPSHEISWKWVVGAIVFVIVLILGTILFTRSWKTHQVLEATQQSEVQALLKECEGVENQETCQTRAIGSYAQKLGAVEICKVLEGDAFDECVWSVARDRENVDFCKEIIDVQTQQICADALYLSQALASGKEKDCQNILDAEKQEGCLRVLAGPLTSENCFERTGDSSYCAQVLLMEQAIMAKDPDICQQITDTNLIASCEDVVGIGDRDGDGLDELQEMRFGTSDVNADSDSDGLSDGEEVNTYFTDPLNPDTDGDGYLDGAEVRAGYSPLIVAGK